MYLNKEIEFKTFISEDKYNELVKRVFDTCKLIKQYF